MAPTGAGDLWDDSALIDAFSQAMTKYKEMHNISNEIVQAQQQPTAVDGGDTSEMSTHRNTDDGKNELEAQDSQHDSMESSTYHFNDEVTSTDLKRQERQHGQELPTSKVFPQVHTGKTSDVYAQASDLQSSRLLNEYYELEEKRQKVLEQLQQSGFWNHQSHVQGSLAGLGSYPGYHVPLEPVLSGSGVVPQVNYLNNNNFPPTPIIEEERMKSSIIENDAIFNGEEKGKEKPVTLSGCESSGSEKDLALVLDSWYSAGYYTGRYVTLQSLKNNHS